MPLSDNHGSSLSLASFGRSILMKGMGREQIHSAEAVHDSSAEDPDLLSFPREVANKFHDLSSVGDDELLSLVWMKRLLDAFLSCQEEFRALLLKNKELISKSPLDRLIADYFDKSVKALDICNATRDGIERVRQWEKHMEIAISGLDYKTRLTLSEGQLRRARKALTELSIAMLDEKESGGVMSRRNRSFGRHNGSGSDRHHTKKAGHSRSLSWSVSHSWSALKQLQSIANGLAPPNRAEILATNGVAVPVYAMSCVLMFVLWALVAAIPCQDRSLQCNFSVPKQFTWGTPLVLLHERIIEESKKRERRNSNGLLQEINDMEKCVRNMTDFIDSAEIPLTEEQKTEVEHGMGEMSSVCSVLKSGLDPLELQVREAFRKIMSCRIEGLDLLAGVFNSE
ncbi:hypothetical protein V2J09_012666 [Rumex salicifolius]